MGKGSWSQGGSPGPPCTEGLSSWGAAGTAQGSRGHRGLWVSGHTFSRSARRAWNPLRRVMSAMAMPDSPTLPFRLWRHMPCRPGRRVSGCRHPAPALGQPTAPHSASATPRAHQMHTVYCTLDSCSSATLGASLLRRLLRPSNSCRGVTSWEWAPGSSLAGRSSYS